MKYVDVIIDNNSDRTDSPYTYACAFERVKPGDRVFVPFARGNRERAAFVMNVGDAPAPGLDAKRLKQVTRVDEELSLGADAPALCAWMRERYFCRYIEAIRCFLPTGDAPKRRVRDKSAFDDIPQDSCPPLTREQEAAMARISPRIESGLYRTFLVHGVTGSGKTELYLRAAERALTRGRSVMILVPEISLTPQTVGRFIARFGRERVAVLHSGLARGARYDEWLRARRGEARIVVGARSAVFAPLDDIGLIVVDEEHEGTYKSDMAPKYDTAEVAIKRARQSGAVVLLGSATPSLVSTYRAETGYYERLRLTKRYNDAPLPEARIVDMREELRAGNKTIFSLPLYRAARETLDAGRQAIFFLNRRGYSTFISCRACGYVMKCEECGIALTYHKAENEARCHICGARARVPALCPECRSPYLKFFGVGTEKVEEAAREVFPEAVIDRLDMDTARRKGAAQQMLARFGKGKTDILIGTQLVAKGLDFANVGLVGVISADVTLNIPDFRSAERAFQLITQAAGRAGRGAGGGRVVIQTYKPEHYAIEAAAKQDYEAFYEVESLMRKTMRYPPFADLAQVIVSAADEATCAARADELATGFRTRVERSDGGGRRVLGPTAPAAVKPAETNGTRANAAEGKEKKEKNGGFRSRICVKLTREYQEEFKRFVREKKDEATVSDGKTAFGVQVDLNPYSLI